VSVARDAGGVLIVRPSSLGDIVYALAVVSDIRRERPALAVDWVAEQGFMPLIELCPDVRRVIAFGLRGWRKSPLAASTWRAIRTFAADLRRTRYDAIVDLQEQVKGALIARAARGERHGFDRESIREPLATLGDDDVRARITAQRGLGPWTAEWFLARHLARPTAWPAGDLALRRAAADLYGVGVHELGPRLHPFQNLAAHYLLTGWLTKP